ncbi:carboxymuconolactone decarboxylase family protein [Desulfosarcina sp. OttesenSCG-928-A07]|nr:carboxymuconolactone decarboxylase family protein [Desulfosarcina sp. OttesenSCG-928-A07]
MNKIIVTFLCMTALTLPDRAEAKTMNELTVKQQSVVAIAAFTAKGDMDRLKTVLNEGLDAGLTINEIKEVLVQMYAYCGFPRSLNALGNFMEVVEERQGKGINDLAGKAASPFPSGKTRLEIGTENQTRLAGGPVKGPLFDFAPAIDAFLKDHLFGDIFGRDNLDWQSREIATVAALSTMDGVNAQLRSHIGISMNVGLTEAQLKDVVDVLHAKVGKKEADNAATELKILLETE